GPPVACPISSPQRTRRTQRSILYAARGHYQKHHRCRTISCSRKGTTTEDREDTELNFLCCTRTLPNALSPANWTNPRSRKALPPRARPREKTGRTSYTAEQLTALSVPHWAIPCSRKSITTENTEDTELNPYVARGHYRTHYCGRNERPFRTRS